MAINRDLLLNKPAATTETHDSIAKARYNSFQALVMQALQLRRIYREAFILCEIRGYSASETASILGITEDSVLRRLARARSEMGLDGEDGTKAIAELVDF
jgi:DNA-directed RNA polymerase specialized sigma24 family protein